MEGRYAGLNAGVNRQDINRQDIDRQDINRQDINRQDVNRQDVNRQAMGAEPRLVHQPELLMMGVEVQFAPSQPVQPGSASLTKLWNRFLAEQMLFDIADAVNPQILYGLYTDYRQTAPDQTNSSRPSQHQNGCLTVPETNVLIVATQVSSIDNPPECMVGLTIPSARYLVFNARDGSGEATLQIWQQVWDYFSAEASRHSQPAGGCTYSRAYTIDFERHESDQTSVYIAVK